MTVLVTNPNLTATPLSTTTGILWQTNEYIQHTYTHLDKDMERERGRKSYLVHNMRQDLAILCSNSNTIATKPVSSPLLEGER